MLPEAAERPRNSGPLCMAPASLSIFLLLAAVTLGILHVLSPRPSPINYFLTRNELTAVPRYGFVVGHPSAGVAPQSAAGTACTQ